MVDLVVRPSGLTDPKRAWSLQLRNHSCPGEVEYATIARLSADAARTIVDAGAPYWLFGDLDRAGRREEPSEFASLAVAPTPPGQPSARFRLGERVLKIKGYAYSGIVVSVYWTVKNEVHYVVEAEEGHGFDGMQQIFAEEQLRSRDFFLGFPPT